MLSTKQLCMYCTHSAVRRLCTIHSNVKSETKREFSSKGFKNGNKNTNRIEVKAKNDFVTHQLNTSIAEHLKRQQKIWNRVYEEEKKLHYQKRRRDYDFEISADSVTKTHDKTKRSGYFEGATHNRKNKNYDQQQRSVNRNNDEDDIDSDDYDREPLEVPNWEDMSVVKINKEFYTPSSITENRSVREISDFQTKKQIKITCDAPKPIFGFDEIQSLAPEIIDEVKKHEFIHCTPIQSQAIPLALSGADIIAISQPR